MTLLAQIQAPDFDFTAYVMWDKFANLTDHDLLGGEFEHADSLLGSTVKAARTRLRAYFRDQERERTRKLVQQWIDEGIYPYSGEPGGPVEVAERDTFNEVASLVNRQLKGPKSARRTQMVLLREALRRQPAAMPKVLDELFGLSGPQKERLEDLVDRTPLSNLIAANAETADRIDALNTLRELLFEFESRYTLREKDQLHRMLEKELWIFGDEYSHTVSEIGLTKALNRHPPAWRTGLCPSSESSCTAQPAGDSTFYFRACQVPAVPSSIWWSNSSDRARNFPRRKSPRSTATPTPSLPTSATAMMRKPVGSSGWSTTPSLTWSSGSTPADTSRTTAG
ncbi:hypothetical protein PV416_16665 [Streptomyces ipomoeae]|uniref:Uncharacterized protein n=1 Tax=Streptomyces ipomoeae 91-03 TaxID=698759 RepID=L1KYF6_9ACTN|nr:hypothetical protein [Streptomyces ipomoeae]EKX65368.1 hypothetical protein STRIP9103_09630 [Streptomyces ipomoeae 91-03]MDX2693222.1 hypothetical protein [Streptomyces ipomoeae]MDX2822697.1 hypothetical protein [Streptomyces ipomoeae]MDX2838885.1 hypothetical protein [Streptomyces ipomoeae]MDX2875327.1 hypothetical protein [Streptomyces ipomoeae]